MHQSEEYYKYTHFNIPLDQTVHHTSYEYMARYRWLKYTTKLSNVCGTSSVNNEIILFDGHASNFYNLVLMHTDHQNTQTFVLKADKYGNNQPNDNGMNDKIKSH